MSRGVKLFLATNKGAEKRTRTADLRITNALLYQLSYLGMASPIPQGPKGIQPKKLIIDKAWEQCYPGPMKSKAPSKESAPEAFQRLLEVMATLRGPQGCPWDKKQTHTSLKACLLEETYEVLEAIDSKDPQALQEELGDLLLQVIFQSQIATEEQSFQITEVIHHLVDKLLRRHPHVFGDEEVEHAEEAIVKWEKIKAQEKGKGHSLLSGVPHELPALLRAYRIGSKVARIGFDWPNLGGVLDKVEEEIGELREADQDKDPEAFEEELGDLFFSLAQMARHLKVNPEESLRKSTNKFQRRFEWMEEQLEAQDKSLHDLSLEAMEALWQESKSFTKNV